MQRICLSVTLGHFYEYSHASNSFLVYFEEKQNLKGR